MCFFLSMNFLSKVNFQYFKSSSDNLNDYSKKCSTLPSYAFFPHSFLGDLLGSLLLFVLWMKNSWWIRLGSELCLFLPLQMIDIEVDLYSPPLRREVKTSIKIKYNKPIILRYRPLHKNNKRYEIVLERFSNYKTFLACKTFISNIKVLKLCGAF